MVTSRKLFSVKFSGMPELRDELNADDLSPVITHIFSITDAEYLVSYVYHGQRYYMLLNTMTHSQQGGAIEYDASTVPFFPQWQSKEYLIGECNGVDIQK